MLAFAGRSRGMLPGPWFPQQSQFGGVLNRIAGSLGRSGPYLGGPAMGSAIFWNAFLQAQKRGQIEQAAMHERQFAESLRETIARQNEMNRVYGDVLAVYGPGATDDKGREKPFDHDKLNHELWAAADRFQDNEIKHYLTTGGPDAAENILRHRDGHGQDAAKLQLARLREIQIRNAELSGEATRQRIDLGKRKLQSQQDQLGPYLAQPGSAINATAPSAGGDIGPPPAGAPAGNLDWTQDTAGGETGDGTGPGPSSAGADVGTDNADAAGDTGGAAAEPGPQAGATPATQAAQAGEPQERAVGEAPLEAPNMTPDQPAQPAEQQVAQAEPAPDQAATPRADRLDINRATTPTGRPQVRVPAAPAPETQARPGYEWQPTPSRVRQFNNQRMSDPDSAGQQHPQPFDWNQIDSIAQQTANGQFHIQQQRATPAPVVAMAQARSNEIVRDMQRILQDPNLQGDDVLRALDKVNPQFAGSLRGYVSGAFAIPSSAWNNQSFLQLTYGLARKVDPTLTGYTFKNRGGTVMEFIKGASGKLLRAEGAGIKHAYDLLDMINNRPGAMERLLSSYQGTLSNLASPEARERMGALQAAIFGFNHEFGTLMSQGGAPRVHDVEAQEAQLPLVMGDYYTMRGNIIAKMNLMRQKVDSMKEQMEAGTGKPPPEMLQMFDRYQHYRPSGSEMSSPVGIIDQEMRDILMNTGPYARPWPGHTAPGTNRELPPGYRITPVE